MASRMLRGFWLLDYMKRLTFCAGSAVDMVMQHDPILWDLCHWAVIYMYTACLSPFCTTITHILRAQSSLYPASPCFL